MAERRYPLTYEIRAEDPPLTRREIDRERGACDAALVVALQYPAEGSPMVHFATMDGRTGDDLSDAEIYRCWAMLAKRLAESPTLQAYKRQLARNAWEASRVERRTRA